MWKAGGDFHPALMHIEPLRRSERLQLRGRLEASVLLGIEVLHRAHRLPRGIGVAVILIDAEMLEQDTLEAGGKSLNGNDRRSRRRGGIEVPVVPEEHRG